MPDIESTILTAGASVKTCAVEPAMPKADTDLGVRPVALIRTSSGESAADMALAASMAWDRGEVLVVGWARCPPCTTRCNASDPQSTGRKSVTLKLEIDSTMLTAETSVRTRVVVLAMPKADTYLSARPVALIRTASEKSAADMAPAASMAWERAEV